jgi:hypothetical protein
MLEGHTRDLQRQLPARLVCTLASTYDADADQPLPRRMMLQDV